MVTCNLDGAWEPSEPDCGKLLSTGTSVVTSTTQSSTAPPFAENQTRTTTLTTPQAYSSTRNTTEDGGEYYEVNHFQQETFCTAFGLTNQKPLHYAVANN